jgi:DNA-binding NarL/FixJ family response regulator
MISVALVKDNRVGREGMAALVKRSAGLDVITAVQSGDALLRTAVMPNVILFDAGLWNKESVRVVEMLRRAADPPKVIIMDLPAAHGDVVAFVHAGVSGFVLCDATVEELITTIRAVARGERVVPPQMTSSLFSQVAKDASVKRRAMAIDSAKLTMREREIAELIAAGLSNNEIAFRLRIAAHTTKSHVRNVMKKLGLHSRLQIAAFARRPLSK